MPTYDLSKPIPPDQWLTAERLRKLRRDAIDTPTKPGEEEAQFAVCAAVDELIHRRKMFEPVIAERDRWEKEAARWRARAEHAASVRLVTAEVTPVSEPIAASWTADIDRKWLAAMDKHEGNPFPLDTTIGQLRMRDIADAPDALNGIAPDLVIRSALYWLNHLANLQHASATAETPRELHQSDLGRRLETFGGDLVKHAEELDSTIEQHGLDIVRIKTRMEALEADSKKALEKDSQRLNFHAHEINLIRQRLAKLETAAADDAVTINDAKTSIKWLDRAQEGDALEARIDGRWHEAVIHELVANERGKVTAIKVRITEADYPPARAIVLYLMVTDPATTNFSVHDNLRPSRDPRPASWSDAHHAWLTSLKEGDEVEIRNVVGGWSRGKVAKVIHHDNDTYGFTIATTMAADREGGTLLLPVERTFTTSITDALTMLRRPRVGSGG